MPFLFNNANMYIDQYNGIIGVGTNTPTANLHIIGTGLITGNLSVTTMSGILSTSTQPNVTLVGTLSNLFVNSGFNISSTGNVGVGIGTAISNSNIHVQGTSKFLSSTGATGLYVSSLGNVGIGTASPNANLHVMGYTQILGTSGTGGLFIDTVGEVGINTSNPTSNLHVLGTTQILGISGSTGLYISNIGNVGIGTAFPMANLHVLGNSQLLNLASTTGLYISNTGNVGIGTSVPTGNLHVLGHTRLLGQSGLTGLYISNIGNVGIGTAFPMANLHVLGNSQLLNLTSTTGLYISNTGNVGIGTSIPTGNLHVLGFSQILGSAGSTGLYVSNIGNVGIGTAFPMANLHVLGNSQILGSAGTTGLYISNTGNVGIGTSVPTGNLHVLGYTQILNPTGTNGIYVATTGNVGIGSTNPQYNLDITGTMRTSNVAIFQGLATQFSTFGASLGMDQNNHCCLQLTANTSITSLYSYIDFSNIGNDFWGRILYDNLTHNLQFHTKGSERLRIDTNGNVGIGTGTPLANLHVFTGLTTIPSSGGIVANIGGPLSILHGSNDLYRMISALDTNMSTSTSRYICVGQAATSLNQAELAFNYVSSGSTSNYLSLGLYGKNIMNMTGAGYVGIGTTNPSYPLYVLTAGATYGGTSRNYFGQSTTSSLGTNGSASTNVSAVFQGDVINVAGNYVAYSDVRIKKDIISLDPEYCLELLLQLRVVEHGYIDELKYPKKKINFIAQEVEEVLPLAIETVTEYIPSIFNKYLYQKITNTTYCILDIHFDFIQLGSKLKILTETEEFITVVINITQDTLTIKTEKELADEIFVYGHNVTDCRTLNNDTLYTICVGAVQENNKRIIKLEQKLKYLEEKINKLI